MLPATIIERARRLSSTSSKYYTDAFGIDDLNQVKNDLWSAIVTHVNEDSYWQEWNQATVSAQSEYPLPPIASTTSWMKKLKDVKIAYDSQTYSGTTLMQYVVAKQISPSALANPWSYYVEFQDPLRPIYYLADNSIFIAPAPTLAVTAWIVITWVRSIPDYNLSTTGESDMIIPLDQQELLRYWLIPYIYDMKTMAAESEAARQRYEFMKANMVLNLSDRVESPFNNQYPDDLAQQVSGNINPIITL